MKVKTVFAGVGVIALLAFLTAPAHATPPPHASAPIRLTFEKLYVPGTNYWIGMVDGDFSGPLTVELTSGPPVTGSIWHVSFHWEVEAGANSFEADVRGIINLKTGRVVLNGVVTDGPLMGAQLHIEAQLNESFDQSEGTIRIMPSS